MHLNPESLSFAKVHRAAWKAAISTALERRSAAAAGAEMAAFQAA